jgi:indolepyruvate ferredoxin oxidoreductase beta subunit
MKCDIILAGVGGQGILTIAYFLDHAAVARGYHFKQAEVHGMAQRGGAVYSHLRIADHEVISDLVPLGSADLVLAVEPLEVQRYLQYLAAAGTVVASNQPFKNIPDYPEEERVIAALLSLPRSILVNAKQIAAEARSPRAENVAMLGAATPFLPFSVDDFVPLVTELFERKGPAVVESNLMALRVGHAVGTFFRDLVAAGAPPASVYALSEKLTLATVDPALAAAFVPALRAHSGTGTDRVRALTGRSACTRELAGQLAS